MLRCADVEVSYVDAILGTTVQVATVDGPVDLKVPAGEGVPAVSMLCRDKT